MVTLTPWRGNGRVLFEASSLHHFRSSNVCNIFIKYISLMFKHLTLKRVAVLVLLGTIKLIIYNDMFPGVRKGIINLFNFKSINFNLVSNPTSTSTSTSAIAKISYASSSEGDHTSKRPKN